MNDDAGNGEDGVGDTGHRDGDDDQDDHSEDDDYFYTEAWFLRKSSAVNIVGLLNDSLSCQML